MTNTPLDPHENDPDIPPLDHPTDPDTPELPDEPAEPVEASEEDVLKLERTTRI